MLFFDTYAIFEIINSNPEYQRFSGETIITSVLNIGELYYGLLKQGNRAKADAWVERLQADLIEIDPETMKRAMTFKYVNRKKKLSMVDCVGYVLAHKLGVRFLTGDKEFKDLAGVEFVK